MFKALKRKTGTDKQEWQIILSDVQLSVSATHMYMQNVSLYCKRGKTIKIMNQQEKGVQKLSNECLSLKFQEDYKQSSQFYQIKKAAQGDSQYQRKQMDISIQGQDEEGKVQYIGDIQFDLALCVGQKKRELIIEATKPKKQKNQVAADVILTLDVTILKDLDGPEEEAPQDRLESVAENEVSMAPQEEEKKEEEVTKKDAEAAKGDSRIKISANAQFTDLQTAMSMIQIDDDDELKEVEKAPDVQAPAEQIKGDKQPAAAPKDAAQQDIPKGVELAAMIRPPPEEAMAEMVVVEDDTTKSPYQAVGQALGRLSTIKNIQLIQDQKDKELLEDAAKHKESLTKMQAAIRGFLVRRVYHKDVVNMLKNLDLKELDKVQEEQPEEQKETYESIKKQMKILSSMFNADPNNYLAVNDKGQIEIKNTSDKAKNICMDTLKIKELPQDIRMQLWNYINGESNEQLKINF